MINNSANRKFFNSKAIIWDTITKHNPTKINFLLKLLNLKTGNTVLDVGTGTGILIPFLYEFIGQEGHITAVDIADKMLMQAQKKFARFPVEFLCTDVTNLNKPRESFAAIVCYSVFPHFVHPQQTLKTLTKLLKKDGRLLICHSEGRQTINIRHQELEKHLHSHPLPPAADLIDMCKRLGLVVLDYADKDNFYYMLATVKSTSIPLN
jgi:ubiquinone/menaquinone biosynthesis C-methylase UbiE